MSEELETLINNLEDCIGIFDYMLTPIENYLLLSYINELQQENNQLKERIEYLERSNNRREETILDLRSENVDLATKIDKAIEIIESCNLGIFDYSIDQLGIIKLLEILKDSDVDEC